jgi:hypothetical protein
MPKLSRNSIGEYNKSCSAPHQESSTIEFAIFHIFYDFLEILQVSANVLYYWSYPFASRTLQRTETSQLCPWFTENTLERLGACNATLGRGGGAARPIPVRPAALPAV